jgi:hypothetical protein
MAHGGCSGALLYALCNKKRHLFGIKGDTKEQVAFLFVTRLNHFRRQPHALLFRLSAADALFFPAVYLS